MGAIEAPLTDKTQGEKKQAKDLNTHFSILRKWEPLKHHSWIKYRKKKTTGK